MNELVVAETPAPADPHDGIIAAPSSRTAIVVAVVAGLILLSIVVAGGIFLFGPGASAAGSCGGG